MIKKILILNDSYFSYNPTNQNVEITKYIESLENSKNINVVEKEEEKTETIRESSTINKIL